MIDYNIDWERWLRLMLPLSLRRPRIIALLTAMIRPLATLYAWARAERADDLEQLETTGQVCYLRGALQRHLPSDIGLRYRVETAPRSSRMCYALDQAQREGVVAQEAAVPLAIDEALERGGHNLIRIGVPIDIYGRRLGEVITLVDRIKLPTKRVEYYPINNPLTSD